MSISGFFPPRGRPTAAFALALATGVPGEDAADDAPPEAVETSSSAVEAAAAAQDAIFTALAFETLFLGDLRLNKTDNYRKSQAPTSHHTMASETLLGHQQNHPRQDPALRKASHGDLKSGNKRMP